MSKQMAKRKIGRKRLRVRDFPRRQQLVGVPPANSEIWPEPYRGKRWKPVYGIMFQGKCQLCAYSSELPKSRRLLDAWYGQSRVVLCTNHPGSPGELVEMLPMHTCRNFKSKPWHLPRVQPAKRRAAPLPAKADETVRRVPLGNGLFAVVDAEDYEEVSKYKWRASHHGRTIYATCVRRGRVVYMHRMLMHARKGQLVDHADGNGLNNRRCNLRLCNHQQNRANVGPRGGASRYVGVYRCKGRWAARIVYRGKTYQIGTFDTEIEAAKARDRKAYEFFGEYAYLNFPEDFRGKGRAGSRKKVTARKVPRAGRA
jgi:hypothetical protein